ncbi:MAG: transcriptional initiation protein Tat [Sphingobacteriales bacterium 12-47-4]|nr:MAG: transcriptional initiation protein Tat [Sphingobacteriales bacterium 12-47-4]
MDRRESLRLLATGAIAGGSLLAGCNDKDGSPAVAGNPDDIKFNLDRAPEEQERDSKLMRETFFTPEEMVTIGVLADIIIPKDEVSGSATDAKVPDFIEFIVKDMPSHQNPMRGGLRWLDVHCLKEYGKPFSACANTDQLKVVEAIAYPNKVQPGFEQGASFFTLMRNLTATGFYTSEIGVKDVGYVGNTPNKWNGVPDDVLKQYGLSYTDKENQECVKYD